MTSGTRDTRTADRPVRASLGTHRRALTARVSPQQERGASLVVAWACADTDESVPGFGPNFEGQGCCSRGGACATVWRAIKDGAGYRRGIRIQDRPPQRTPYRGLIASRQGLGRVVASRLGELTTRERQRSSSAFNRPSDLSLNDQLARAQR
jgi:hypothetical protein